MSQHPFENLTSQQMREWSARFRENLGSATILNDLIFKRLFGERGKSEEQLISLINAVRKQVSQSEIIEVEILDPENRPSNLIDKITYLDLKARDDKGSLYKIEVQRAPQRKFISRTVFYNSLVHSRQLKKRDAYGAICPTISIVLTDYTLFDDMPGPFQSFRLMSDTNPPRILTNDLQFYFLQFGKNFSPESCSGLNQDLVDWMLALNYPRTEESVMQQVLYEHVTIAKGWEDLSHFVAEPRTRNFIDDLEKYERDRFSEIDSAKQEGIAEGEAIGKFEGKLEGKLEGKQEVARRLQRKGFDVEAIAEITELPINEVELLLNAGSK